MSTPDNGTVEQWMRDAAREFNNRQAARNHLLASNGETAPVMTENEYVEIMLATLRSHVPSSAPADIHEQIGRIMHESWAKTKRAQGFHGPNGVADCPSCDLTGNGHSHPPFRCDKFHADLIPWEQLPEKQKDINRHAFDAVLESGILVPAAPTTETVGEELRKAAQKVCDTWPTESATKIACRDLRAALSRSAVPAATPENEAEFQAAVTKYHNEHIAPMWREEAAKLRKRIAELEADRPPSPAPAETVRREALLDAIGGLIATYETADHADNPCGTCAICSAEKAMADFEQHSTAPEQGEGGRK